MAKGKHSVALFEVIQKNKTSRRGMSDLLRTPNWWFKRRGVANPAQPASATTEAPPTMLDEQAQSTAPAPHVPGIDLKLDPERQRIRFTVSYTSAIVALFAISVVVALSYLIGTRMSRGPAPAMAGPSTEQIRQAAPRPQVLDVRAASPVKQAATPEPDEAKVADPAPAAPVAAAEASGKRIIGRNYIVVQSYPDAADAQAAAELLNKNGVPCTVEHGLRGFNNWYSVVGLTGFDRITGNTEYELYIRKLRSLNTTFAGTSKFKKFEPLAYKWRG